MLHNSRGSLGQVPSSRVRNLTPLGRANETGVGAAVGGRLGVAVVGSTVGRDVAGGDGVAGSGASEIAARESHPATMATTVTTTIRQRARIPFTGFCSWDACLAGRLARLDASSPVTHSPRRALPTAGGDRRPRGRHVL
jgi:hypothetical protein